MKLGIIGYQPDSDFVYKDSPGDDRPHWPAFNETHKISIDGKDEIKFRKPEDVPLNKRNFCYRTCGPNPYFTQLGYACSEYPYEQCGMNTMDRSDGMSLIDGSNSTVSVDGSVGWRTSRCDACIKEGTCYWEVEVVNGGLSDDVDTSNCSALKLKELLNSTPHLRVGISRREAALESPVGFDSYGYSVRDIALESIHQGKITQTLQNTTSVKRNDRIGFLLKLPSFEEQKKQAEEYVQKRIDALIQHMNGNAADVSSFHNNNAANDDQPFHKKKARTVLTRELFEKALLEDIDQFNIIRDKIPIRYKNQLFFESTDYVKTTKPEYYWSDKSKGQTHYTLKDSSLSVYLNGSYVGDAFTDLKPFLPPFSQLQYNEKFYFGYWKNGEILEETNKQHSNDNTPSAELSSDRVASDSSTMHKTRKGIILKNRYVNNNQLGYYPTISCFNGGTAKIITSQEELKHLQQIKDSNPDLKTLDQLFMEQIADDIVWDIIDELEEEF